MENDSLEPTTNMEMPRRAFVSTVALNALPMLSRCLRGQDLESLPAEREFESHRVTSADPTGGNDDFRDLGTC